MKPTLSKLLEKKGIKDVNDLSREEKDTFDRYQKILSKKELTLEDLKKFLETQITIIELKWKDFTVSQSHKAEMIPIHTTYKTILEAIDAPQYEREALEKFLVQQLQ